VNNNRPSRWILAGASLGALLLIPQSFAVAHSVSYGLNAADLVELLVGQNGGITVVGTPTLTGFSGDVAGEPAYSSGSFLVTGANSGIPFSNGLILSTGDIRDSVGLNDDIANSTAFDSPGSSLLEGIHSLGPVTSDAVTLTFQFKSATPSFSFRYLFGSEEYNSDFMGSDAFAFVLYGPDAVDLNLAKVPFTSTDVTIDSVNGSSNSAYFADNSQGLYDIQYNGLVGSAGGMQAGAAVQVDAIYTLTIVIADSFDSAFDSALFLGAGSFVADGFESAPVPEPTTWIGGLALAALAARGLRKRR
jgi:hypothetical protein